MLIKAAKIRSIPDAWRIPDAWGIPNAWGVLDAKIGNILFQKAQAERKAKGHGDAQPGPKRSLNIQSMNGAVINISVICAFHHHRCCCRAIHNMFNIRVIN